MQVAKNSVVAIDYKLTDDSGEVIDSSEGQEPLAYLHGAGNIIPGLEEALDGKVAGDQLQVAVPAEDGYGERSGELVQVIAREQFGDVEDLRVGMQFQVQTDEGYLVFTVVRVDGDAVTIDGNHPLAGRNLNFDVTVRDVREATDEELSHGHVHGGESCGH
jgi:FKBP-type peptidyl-prolyl cis-trans isomerase SlyD